MPAVTYATSPFLTNLTPGKNFLDALPVNDILPINVLDGNSHDLCRSSQAKRLSQLHCWLWMNVLHVDDKENGGFVWESGVWESGVWVVKEELG
jgi:hypothetical protein